MLPKQTNDEWFQAASSPYPGAAPSYNISMPPLHPASSPFESGTNGTGDPSRASGNMFAGLTTQMREHAMSYVAQEAVNMTRSRAGGISRFFSIDWLVAWVQPYFMVDAPMVLQRMKSSLLPKAQLFSIHEPDLYGPVVITFTMALLLRICLNASEVKKSAGSTAIGTSLAVCFAYWLGTTGVLFVASYASDTRLTLPSMLCIVGYSMTSWLIILPLAYFGSLVFYLLFLTLGAAAAVSIALTVKQATPDVKRGATTAAICAAAHMLYLLYLKWSYLA